MRLGMGLGLGDRRRGRTLVTVATDAFTGTNGDSLSGRTADSGGTWALTNGGWSIYNNRARGGITTAGALLGSALQANQWSQADFVVLSGASTIDTHAVFIVVRGQDGSNFYAAGFRSNDQVLAIWKMVGGVNSDLATASRTITNGETMTLRFEAVGDTLTLYDGNSIAVTATDSSFSSTGKPGLRATGTTAGNTTRIHIDNFAAGTL